MIRITGGRWRGRKLRTPKGRDTRPTSSRVRESLFNVLGAQVGGCVFVDLFAGSGAVGIEALSRGAPGAVFVENNRKAMACIRANLELLGRPDGVECIASNASTALESRFGSSDGPSIVFLDPPYEQGLAAQTLEALGRLEPAPVLCAAQVERDAPLEEAYGPLRLEKVYSHGDTKLWLYSGCQNNVRFGVSGAAKPQASPEP